MAVERFGPLLLRRGQHRVEERDRIPARTNHRRGIERPERRVRLLSGPQLGIEPQEVRLAEKHVWRHGYATAFRAGARGELVFAARR